ncbi:thioredoxin-like protein [Ochromonadaceae sp. CCMP2298]|nr:thioredoxin-like protein [Ochromonadaceae sp. CCMP2298]
MQLPLPILLALAVLVCLFPSGSSYALQRLRRPVSLRPRSSARFSSELPELDDATRGRIEALVQANKVVLFMKGVKGAPKCGFSDTACRILNVLATPFETVDVLEDEYIRYGIKLYSSWPTIPQLYVNGEFVGGSDIMYEMYESGELAELIELANAN